MQVALSEDPAWFTPKAGSPAASRGRAADAAAAGTKELPIPSRRLSRMPARRLVRLMTRFLTRLPVNVPQT